MPVKTLILVISYLTSEVLAITNHAPQVYENLDEHPPQYVRAARHLNKNQKIYSPIDFRRTEQQQDRLKSKYHHQQQADLRNLKFHPNSGDLVFGLNNRGKIAFNDNNNEWKPFQPSFIKQQKSLIINNQQKKVFKAANNQLKKTEYSNNIDLDIAGTEAKDEVIKSDRTDQQSQYVYVSPNVIQNNFGLDSKASQQIVQNSASDDSNTDSERYQINELQELVGKSPNFQLESLKKLLGDAKSGEPTDKDAIQIEHNGTPQLDILQQQLDAVNKEREEQVLAAAQKQAEAHVQAQHQAIALAQKQAQEEAFAKIAAHNQGIATISPQATVPSETEVSALQARPLEQVIVKPSREYGNGYASATEDAKPSLPAAVFHPAKSARNQYPTAEVPLYNFKEVQNYSPVSPYTPHLDAPGEVQIVHRPTEATLVNVEVTKPVNYHVEAVPTDGKQLYSEEQPDDLHQYAAKYAFGYRILDEKHGNDFGHEEERNGKLTKGHYYVRLPDGRKQSVEYYADNSGYHAKVSYENVAAHPYSAPHNTHPDHEVQLESVHQ